MLLIAMCIRQEYFVNKEIMVYIMILKIKTITIVREVLSPTLDLCIPILISGNGSVGDNFSVDLGRGWFRMIQGHYLYCAL